MKVMHPFFVNNSPLPEWFPRLASTLSGKFVNNLAGFSGLVYKTPLVASAVVLRRDCLPYTSLGWHGRQHCPSPGDVPDLFVFRETAASSSVECEVPIGAAEAALHVRESGL